MYLNISDVLDDHSFFFQTLKAEKITVWIRAVVKLIAFCLDRPFNNLSISRVLYDYTHSVTSETLICLAQLHRELWQLISELTHFYCASVIRIKEEITVTIMKALFYSYLIIHFKIAEITIMIKWSYLKNLYDVL